MEDYTQAAIIRDQIRDLKDNDPALVLKKRLQEAILAEDYSVSLTKLLLCKDMSLLCLSPAVAHACSDPLKFTKPKPAGCLQFHRQGQLSRVSSNLISKPN